MPLSKFARVSSGYGFPCAMQGKKNKELPFYKVSDMNLYGNEVNLEVANNYVSREDLRTLNARTFQIDSIVFPKIGAAISTNKKRMLGVEGLVDNNIMVVTVYNHEVAIPRYLFHYFLTMDLRVFATNSGAVPSIRKTAIQDINIPLPPLDEQRRIVKILDSFEALVNDISSGLPAEIEARRKQYAYYRDQLLDFPELKA